MLDTEAFEAFCHMLDAPMPKAAVDLLSRVEDWAWIESSSPRPS